MRILNRCTNRNMRNQEGDDEKKECKSIGEE